MKVKLCLIVLIVLSGYWPKDKVCYASRILRDVVFEKTLGEFTITSDNGEDVAVTCYMDERGIIYWYRNLSTPVCLDGECMLINIGIYWDYAGDFFGLEVYDQPLTKFNHLAFSKSDYEKLETTLQNDWSILREYKLNNLIDQDLKVDGVSGATIQEVADETVKDAVYTTYTIWHLVHLGEKEQLINLTTSILNEENTENGLFRLNTVKANDFLLNQLNRGYLVSTPVSNNFVLYLISHSEIPVLVEKAYDCLAILNINDNTLGPKLERIFADSSIVEKLKFLTRLSYKFALDSKFFQQLERELDLENEWFTIKIIEYMEANNYYSPKTVWTARKLLRSKEQYISKISKRYISKNAN